MERFLALIILGALTLSQVIHALEEQLPCIPRPGDHGSGSVVCVCNATYCDNAIREAPKDDEYIVYTSTAKGQRLVKTKGKITKCDPLITDCGDVDKMLIINPEIKYQRIEGFGGSVTDSASYMWKTLPEAAQKRMIDSYYNAVTGIGYSMSRVPIGGTDFSLHNYTLNSYPLDDYTLSNFSLSAEDYYYKIPMINEIKKAMGKNGSDLEIVATTWSPPYWMKNVSRFNTCGHLKKDAYQAYADYHRKFVEAYRKQDIPIWAVTTTNEPIAGFFPIPKHNCLGFFPTEMAEFIEKHLGPTARSLGVKLLSVDDQRATIPMWFSFFEKKNPKIFDFIDGIAVHWYADSITPASIMSEVAKKHPDKFIIYTESSEGAFPWDTNKVVLGSWTRAETYIDNILEDLNHFVVGWIDWNMCLNEKGGPTWIENFIDSPIIVFPEKGEFVKQPMFYALAHVAKFIPRGSHRVKVIVEDNNFNQVIETAVITPDNTIVAVLANKSPKSSLVGLRLGDRVVTLNLEGHSITTVEFNNNYDASCKMRTMTQPINGRPIDVNYDDESVTITYIPC